MFWITSNTLLLVRKVSILINAGSLLTEIRL